MQMPNLLASRVHFLPLPAGARHAVVDKLHTRVSHCLAKRRAPQQARRRALQRKNPEFTGVARQCRVYLCFGLFVLFAHGCVLHHDLQAALTEFGFPSTKFQGRL